MLGTPAHSLSHPLELSWASALQSPPSRPSSSAVAPVWTELGGSSPPRSSGLRLRMTGSSQGVSSASGLHYAWAGVRDGLLSSQRVVPTAPYLGYGRSDRWHWQVLVKEG